MSRKPANPPGRRADLTGLELELMQAVWERGNATAAEVGAALRESRPLAPSTVHTVLSKLRKKGYLQLVPNVEGVLRYAPRVPREEEGGRRLRRLLRDFFGNSPQRLMAHLVRESDLDEKELAEIRELLGIKDDQGGRRP